MSIVSVSQVYSRCISSGIVIIGYWYDQNAMQTIVNSQFTPPSSDDMEDIIQRIADTLPLIAIMLLSVRIWYIIKKRIFKL